MNFCDLQMNILAKRAIEIAISGNHKIAIIDQKNSLTDNLVELSKVLAVSCGCNFDYIVTSYCPCKGYGSYYYSCNCSNDDISSHKVQFEKQVFSCDMIIECVPENVRVINNDSDEQIIKRILESRNEPVPVLSSDEKITYIMNLFTKEIKIQRMAEITNVASTIAKLDHAKVIDSIHILEAISYQMLLTHFLRGVLN